MNSDSGTRRARRIAQAIGSLNLLMVLGSVIIALGYGIAIVDPFQLTFILTAFSYSVLAMLIITRQPAHKVGWIFLIIGFVPSFTLLLRASSELIGWSSDQVEDMGNLIGNIAFFPTYLVPLTLVLQYFPTGELPSKRWWPLPLLTIITIIGMMSAELFHPWPWEAMEIYGSDNPLAIPGSERFFESVQRFSQNAFGLALLGSLTAVLVRYRRSEGTERVQMKWLVYAAVIGITTLIFIEEVTDLITSVILDLDTSSISSSVGDIVLLSLPVLFSIVIGIAILRYRLFDIDVIIRRTLQYTLLTSILGLIYFGIVIILQTVFSTVGDQQSPLFIVISTLIIAGLFNPLRRRIQEIIDRRFYRKKYEAEQALAQFAAAARDEVDLHKLTVTLLEVVQDTMQPAHIGFKLLSKDE